MEQVNILDARNNLSRLVSAAGKGEDVVIARRGLPMVRLVPIEADAPVQHTAGQIAEWLTTNIVPRHASRLAAELDPQIASEREGWE
jgi:prevent-host-death family protein